MGRGGPSTVSGGLGLASVPVLPLSHRVTLRKLLPLLGPHFPCAIREWTLRALALSFEDPFAFPSSSGLFPSFLILSLLIPFPILADRRPRFFFWLVLANFMIRVPNGLPLSDTLVFPKACGAKNHMVCSWVVVDNWGWDPSLHPSQQDSSLRCLSCRSPTGYQTSQEDSMKMA